jgi:hypothetical protein
VLSMVFLKTSTPCALQLFRTFTVHDIQGCNKNRNTFIPLPSKKKTLLLRGVRFLAVSPKVRGSSRVFCGTPKREGNGEGTYCIREYVVRIFAMPLPFPHLTQFLGCCGFGLFWISDQVGSREVDQSVTAEMHQQEKEVAVGLISLCGVPVGRWREAVTLAAKVATGRLYVIVQRDIESTQPGEIWDTHMTLLSSTLTKN